MTLLMSFLMCLSLIALGQYYEKSIIKSGFCKYDIKGRQEAALLVIEGASNPLKTTLPINQIECFKKQDLTKQNEFF